MLNNFITEIKNLMEKKIYLLKKKINTINNNKISLDFFNNILINYKNKKISLKEISHITMLNNYSLKINIYDNIYTKNIIKAINNFNLGYIILPIDKSNLKLIRPPITLDKKKILIKLLLEEKENRKISIRNIRKDYRKKAKYLLNNKKINKDEYNKINNNIQNITNNFLNEIINLINNKINIINN